MCMASVKSQRNSVDEMSRSKPKKVNKSRRKRSSVRIVAGSMRGRNISFMSEDGLRPTLARVRETLFNWLAANIAGSNCLDLFAGSGAIGIEALSRGAKTVTFVDSSLQVTENLKENFDLLRITNSTLVNTNASDFLKNNSQLFDIVFLDPPFRKNMLEDSLNRLIPHLSKHALVYIEQEISEEISIRKSQWEIVKTKQTGSFIFQLLTLKTSD